MSVFGRTVRRVPVRGVLGLAAVLAGTGTWLLGEPVLGALRDHPYFSIDRLVVEGEGRRLTDGTVRRWLGFDDGTTLWDASPARVRERLRQHPWVASATVRRQFPDTFEIRLRERHPVALVVLDDLFFVGRGGAVFGPPGNGDDVDLPLITGIGPTTPAAERRWAIKRALRLVRLVERAGIPFEVSEVQIDPERGAVLYPTTPRVPVVLGWGSLRTKLERAAEVLARWGDGAERLAEVDLRFRNQVVVTLGAEERAERRGPGERAGRG